MSRGSGAGGRLVVVDRLGRDARAFPLRAGLATLGSDSACDIRVLLPDVAPHHATIAVHTAQTVIRNVSGAATLVNGAAVSVAALRHGDVITLADRRLRWEYDDPTGRRQPRVLSPSVKQLAPTAAAAGGGPRGKRRGSEVAATGPLHRDRSLHLALEMNHRASMPGSSGGKQVAIVQPQRRDTSEQIGEELGPKRRSNGSESPSCAPAPAPAGSGGSVPAHTTQATLWIESRKTSPRRAKSLQGEPPAARTSDGASGRMRGRKSMPLRMAVLKRARAHRPSLVKIQAPLTIDYTKQAAIMLMTGHTKSKLSKSPSYVVKKPSPVRKTPRNSRRTLGEAPRLTPGNRSMRSTGNQSKTVLEITDSESRQSGLSSVSTRSSKSPQKSPALPSPKKSALKDTSKKTIRKTESIKFDLSNLENHQESDVVLLSESTKNSDSNVSEEDITLHYSDSSGPTHSPSPRHSIHSRSSRMLEKLGSTMALSPSRTLTPNSPSSKKSARGSLIVQKALDDGSSLTDHTKSIASAFRTRTLSPRKTMESYSIVDLVSLESNDASVYSSADSTNTGDYGTPQTSASLRIGRKTRSTINPTLLGSSTPYHGSERKTRSKSNLTMNVSTRSSISKRRSKSLTTPENNNVSMERSRVSRRSRSRSRINDSDLLLLDDTELNDASPKTSKRPRSSKSVTLDLVERKRSSAVHVASQQTTNEGMSTPENRLSPDEVGTPVLSIQTLLNSSRSSLASQTSSKRGRRLVDSKRKTIGVISEARTRAGAARPRANKSLGFSAKKTVLRLSRGSSETSDKTDEGAPRPDNEETVTPKSAVKLVPEAVKNKHSTAKKPQSKRSLIDDLDQSDFVKHLFNSPVKRKLSQSMTEFSRKHSLLEEKEAVERRRSRVTRSTIVSGEDSVSDNEAVFTPERFVSPIQTPSHSPNMSGIKRLFNKNTPKAVEVRIVRTPRPRRSVKNDLANVSGVKAVFARSPRNRLSDVRVKEVFAAEPDNDLRRVSGVKALFSEDKSPKHDLSNIRSVKRLFAKKSPRNDLHNVSGVKATLRRHTPKNDLTDVRGVRKMFQHEVRGRERRRGRGRGEETADMSGIEELFDESRSTATPTPSPSPSPSLHDSEALFDRLVGKPVIKAVYSKSACGKKVKPRSRPRPPSLHTSIDVITHNVEQWLEMELQKRLHRDDAAKGKVTKELQRLATETVEGEVPIRLSRTRNSSMKKSASEVYSVHTLPIKKRSLVEAPSESNSKKHSLPIKKRAVVHSTPVKGRAKMTMNASELERVSPITVLDHTKDPDSARSTRKMVPVEEKGRRRGARRASPAAAPRRATRAAAAAPAPADRGGNTRRNSLVITKKTPVMSPKADPAAARGADASKLPKTRSTRANNEKTIETPKKTRTRARIATVVVTKPSPQARPRAPRRLPASPPPPAPAPVPARAPRSRRGKIESPKQSQKEGNPTESKTEERPAPKRTRNNTAPVAAEPATAALEEAPKRTRRRKPDQTSAKLEDKSTRRSKRVEIVTNVEVSSVKKRGRPTTKTRNDVEQPAEVEPVTRTRTRRGRPAAAPAPASRARSARAPATAISSDIDTDTQTQTKGRKRKATVPEEISSKVSKSEASKRKATLTKEKKEDSSMNKTVRGRRKMDVPESPAKSSRATRAAKRATTKTSALRGDTPPSARPAGGGGDAGGAGCAGGAGRADAGRKRKRDASAAKEVGKKASASVPASPVKPRRARAAPAPPAPLAPPATRGARTRRR